MLTVLGSSGDVLAKRFFKRDRDAKSAREQFVRLVERMTDDDYASADWQAVLDRA